MSWGRAGLGAVLLMGALAAAGPATAENAPLPLPAAPSTPAAPPIVGAVSLSARCVGMGENAASALKLSYALDAPARVTFTLQRRTDPGLVAPRKCPKPLAPTAKAVAYENVGETGVDAAAGAGYATVQQPGTVTAGTRRAPTTAARTAKPARRPLTGAVDAAGGAHRIALLRALRATGSLAPGRYRVLLQGTGADGAVSNVAVVRFWVLRG